MDYIRKIKLRNESKKSCTKSGLIPIKALSIFVKILRATGLYNIVYTAVLAISNILSRQKLIRFYSQFVRSGDLCFDVGANIGNRTGVFLELGATVVAVEPQDKCMRKLVKKYGNNKNVFLVHKALGCKEGMGNLMLSNSHTVSSMSEEWVDSVRKSDMFFTSTSAFQWNKNVTVPVTTLDKLIEEYGNPAICKVDVEGFEYKVIKGLSRTIGMISFEFTPTPELIKSTIESVRHLSGIGNARFNYSFGETMVMALDEWVDGEKISDILISIPEKTAFSGDVYVRFIN
jgi:FkbM family methyltransferase